MAKIMVMIDIPNYDYDELRELMESRMTSVIPEISFAAPKSPEGYSTVRIHSRYLRTNQEGNSLVFELIGVRP